jgi:all-trans-retinol dehydrogenase (NAD+)
MQPFRDRIILITGGSSGLGLHIAELLAAEGASLILWGRDGVELEAIGKQMNERGQRCATYRCDVSSRGEVGAVARRVLREHGPVDILINNAGVVSGRPLLELSDAEIEQTFDTNALAPIWTTRAFLPAMLERRSGHIVTIASAAGLIGAPKLTDYAASKHAAVGFDDALRVELRHLGHREIRTTVVCPYFIATGMFAGARASTPLFPVLAPDSTARAIVRAIRRGKQRVLLPRAVGVVFFARALPVPVFDWLARALGIARSLDDFEGRGPG